MTIQIVYQYPSSLGNGNTIRPNPDAKETMPENPYTIYLEQGCNHSWSSVICRTPPSENSAILCIEKDYPVEVTYRRTDINGSISYDSYICCDREDLLQVLDWLGDCGFIPCQVWDFDIDNRIDSALQKMFNDTYNHRLQKIQNAADDLYADTEELSYEDERSLIDSELQESSVRTAAHPEGDAKPAFQSLNEQIKLANARVTIEHTDTKTKEISRDNNHF